MLPGFINNDNRGSQRENKKCLFQPVSHPQLYVDSLSLLFYFTSEICDVSSRRQLFLILCVPALHLVKLGVLAVYSFHLMTVFLEICQTVVGPEALRGDIIREDPIKAFLERN